ncbi:glycoside hydrolase family 18 protein [Mycena polygramma]|nr:glycoside hydrolase family 18 protein [Mycena polygramma]
MCRETTHLGWPKFHPGRFLYTRLPHPWLAQAYSILPSNFRTNLYKVMHVSRISRLVLLLGASGLHLVAATPIPDPNPTSERTSSGSAVVAPRASSAPANGTQGPSGTADAPHFVIYAANNISPDPNVQGPPAVENLVGFNVVALAFLFSNGTASKYSQAAQWQQLNASERADIKASYAKAGIKLVVSFGGDQDAPTTAGVDPKTAATTAAQWVKDYDLDGIDVDYEDFDAMNNGKGPQWLIQFTTQLHAELGSNYLITLAPIAGWWAANSPGGGYRAIHQAVGSMINWYNIQFYNYNDSTCDDLLNNSTSKPEISVFEINTKAQVPLDKIVIGKPAALSDVKNSTISGYMNETFLATCVQEAKQKGWNGGIMFWQYSENASAEMQEARKLAFPLS